MTKEFNIMGIKNYSDLLENLQMGHRLCRVEEYRDGTKHLNAVLSADGQYIRWHNFGSSANKANAQEMKFVVEKIFGMSLDEIIRAFVWA